MVESLQEHVAREINWLANKKYNLYHVDKDVSMDLARIAIEAVNSYKHPIQGLCMACGKQTLNLETHTCNGVTLIPTQNTEIPSDFLDALSHNLAIKQSNCLHRFDWAIGNGNICLDCGYCD